MTDLLTRLMDLDRLRLGGEGVVFGFERPLPLWGWGLCVLGALALALWSYSRIAGPLWARTALALVRSAVLVALVVLLCGPQLVKRTETTERDWVLVLVDRSASMTIADVPPAEGAPSDARRTREAQLEGALAQSWPMWRELSKDRIVQWLGFDAGAYDLPLAAEPSATGAQATPGIDRTAPPELSAPVGRRTALGTALDQALARAAARPLAAVVILSDGRSSVEPSRAALRRLQGDRVPVHTVALGSAAPVGDVALRHVDAPSLAFVGDTTPVRVELERLGAGDGAGATVRLLDRATGRVIDEQRAIWTAPAPTSDASGAAQGSAVLTARPDEAGQRTWVIEVVPDGADLIAGNNTADAAIELVDRPLRALYIDGYPRWEQRYLKNLLIREKSITAAALILAPDRRYIQEGDIELDALPDSPEGWSAFDVVILGDVRPEVFTDDQLAHLRERVLRGGMGLVWIGGPAATPAAWWDTPLGDLLPFTSAVGDAAPIGEPVLVERTDAAARLGVMQLGESAREPWPSVLSNPDQGWTLIRWAQRLDPKALKPATEVLARAVPLAPAADPWPLVLSMRYGSGRTLYVATDEIWRWRYGRGEVLPERFWLQMIRLLGRESVARSGRAASLTLSPRRADVDQPVRVGLELLDQRLVDERPPSIAVRLLRRAQGGDTTPTAPVELVLRPDRDDPRSYSAIWLPPEAGQWTVEPVEPLLVGAGLSADARITLPDDELRRPEADHEALATISAETGGSVVLPTELAGLPERIPNRSVRLMSETAESLWDTPLAMLTLVLLLTMEWVGRRVIRLV